MANALTFYTSKGTDIRLGQRIGVGGEGEVYEVSGRAGMVAKIYYEPPPKDKVEKLIVLTRLGTERLLNISAWPVDVLSDKPGGDVVGFIMKKIIDAQEVHNLHSPKSRLDKFPEASWAFLIYVAANFARAVAAVHEHGLVIGDVNPKNTLVTKKATVFLLDCDSFQVSAEGKMYRCDGGFPDYTPPELQGVLFREVDRQQEHDYFGVAVVVFQLLFLGRHPFSGQFLGSGEMPLERAIRELRFAYGSDARSRQMRQPPGTLSLEAVPASLSVLFRRAFLSTSASDRPQPRDWIEPLDKLTKSLRRCALHGGHHYYQELFADCPWCAIETSARIRLFNIPLAGAKMTNGHFRLTEIWKDISSIVPPPENVGPKSNFRPDPEPSAEVIELDRKRKKELIYTIVFSALAGLLIALVTDIPAALFLLGAVAFVIHFITKFGYNISLPSQPSVCLGWIPSHPIIKEIQDAKQQAQKSVSELEENWMKQADNDRFLVKLADLQNQRETYSNLSKIRNYKFAQLEDIARENQRNEFLNRFSINQAEIRGIGPSAKTFIHSNGIRTASDVSENRLKQVPSIGSTRAESLLEWRREVERQFVFDRARAISPQAQIKVEREIDDLRRRLEHELTSGAFYLRRLKDEIEASRSALHPHLNEARSSLARATKDWEIVNKRNRSKPALWMLIIAFIFGSIIEPERELYVTPHAGIQRAVDDTSQPPARPELPNSSSRNTYLDATRARDLYHQGLRFSRQGRFKDAVNPLQESVRFNPRLSEAYEELGYVFYRLKEYEKSIEASKAAIQLANNFGPHYNLGLVYVAQDYWYGAMYSFQSAIAYRDQNFWHDAYTHAYYLLGMSLSKLGEVEKNIERLEGELKDSAENSIKRFELANLYLWSGNAKAAKRQYEILKSKNKVLAEELRTLMDWHSKSPTEFIRDNSSTFVLLPRSGN